LKNSSVKSRLPLSSLTLELFRTAWAIRRTPSVDSKFKAAEHPKGSEHEISSW
jgi:hypothetical protein